MALTYLNSQMIEIPAAIVTLSARNLQTTNLTATSIQTPVLNNVQTWNDISTVVQSNSASWEESADILPTVTNYLSTQSVAISSLNARTFTLVHDPANDGTDPIFDIGETLTGSFSGFRIRYEEPTNRLIGSSRTGTTILTSFMINTATGQVGISGLPAPGQALTVNGDLSATGTANVGNFNIVSGSVFSKTTFNNLVSALAINVNGTTLYMPLLSAI